MGVKLRVHERNLARRLRVDGHSYAEIRAQIGPMSKSTLNRWLRDIQLTPEQQQRLVEKARMCGHSGRQKGALANRMARLERLREAKRVAEQTFPQLSSNPLFPIGVVLYSCEGAKKQDTFAFVNSDPQLVRLMIKWLTEVCDVPATKIRARVYTHRYCDVDPERFWQEVTQLPRAQFRRTIYKATPHAQPKNPSFKGCCRLEVSGVQFLAMIKEWQSLLLQRFLGATGGDSHILPPTAAMYSTPASR